MCEQWNAQPRKLGQGALPPGAINLERSLQERRRRPGWGCTRHCAEYASAVRPLVPPDCMERRGLDISIHRPTVRGLEFGDVIHHQLWNTGVASLRHLIWAAHDDAAGVQASLPRLGRCLLVAHACNMSFSSDGD